MNAYNLAVMALGSDNVNREYSYTYVRDYARRLGLTISARLAKKIALVCESYEFSDNKTWERRYNEVELVLSAIEL